jgi:hypothetical protein
VLLVGVCATHTALEGTIEAVFFAEQNMELVTTTRVGSSHLYQNGRRDLSVWKLVNPLTSGKKKNTKKKEHFKLIISFDWMHLFDVTLPLGFVDISFSLIFFEYRFLSFVVVVVNLLSIFSSFFYS